MERKTFDGLVTVLGQSNDPKINWAAIGSVSVERAEEFVEILQKAIDYAKSKTRKP